MYIYVTVFLYNQPFCKTTPFCITPLKITIIPRKIHA